MLPGIARIPPPADGAAADPNFSSVMLLMGFEGSDGSTTFDDESAANHTLAADGNAQIDTAQFKFGASSLLLDGTGDDVDCGTAVDLDTATNTTPFTIEAFIRFNSTAGDQSISGAWNPPTSGWLWRMTGGSLDWNNFSGTNFSYATFSPSTATWYHVAVCFDGTKTRMYTDGIFRAGTVATQQIGSAVARWAVGAQAGVGGGGRYFNGWIDEYRYTKGVARYTTESSFTVPTEAFPRS